MNTNKLIFDKTITAWDEALPLGNGDLGCLIWDSPDKLRFTIDKAGIWDCSASPESQENFTYANIRELIAGKKWRAMHKKYDDCYATTTPTKLPTGKIIVDLGVGNAVNVVSELDFVAAEAIVKSGGVTARSFIHAERNLGMIEIDKPFVKYQLSSPKYGLVGKGRKRKAGGITQSLLNLHYGATEYHDYRADYINYKYFVQPTNDGEYGIITASLTVDNRTVIAYTVYNSSSNVSVQECIKIVGKAASDGYNVAMSGHKEWWRSYNEDCSITLQDKYIERQWKFNNYILAGASRKGHYPMPLQGVWTADNDCLPPWKGDYHHDLNTQMTYTYYLKANHLGEGESFIDYLINLSDVGARFAEKFYGVKGICLPSVMDIKGQALGGWAQYSLSPTNQLWLCYIMARHYYHTGDMQYLRDKIYPYLVGSGEFISNMLELKGGHYKLALSSSPEIFDNQPRSWVEPNSNYDLALMRQFMVDMVDISSIMGDKEASVRWADMLSKMELLAVNSDNVLMIDRNISLHESHRHHSHCMAIYPLRSMRYDCIENKKIIDSTIANIEKMGVYKWVGYSLGWLANLHVVQENGDKALNMIDQFFRYYCTDNGFHCNGDYRLKTECVHKYRHFTLEGNFIAADAINNMLLYSEADGLKLFPALPSSWTDISFSKLRGYGGILVSAEIKAGKLIKLIIASDKDIVVNIKESIYNPLNVLGRLNITAGVPYENRG